MVVNALKIMSLILVTPPGNHPREHLLLQGMFDEGVLPRLHLRKPRMKQKELELYVESIPKQHRNRIVLHHYRQDDLQLMKTFRLGGVHYPESQIPEGMITAQPGFSTTSIAYHAPDQLLNCKGDVDYVLLSPVYPSISKPDHRPRNGIEDRETLIDYLAGSRYPVFALGGCRPEHFEELAGYGFAGAAILADVWESPDPVAACAAAFERAEAVSWNVDSSLSCQTT